MLARISITNPTWLQFKNKNLSHSLPSLSKIYSSVSRKEAELLVSMAETAASMFLADFSVASASRKPGRNQRRMAVLTGHASKTRFREVRKLPEKKKMEESELNVSNIFRNPEQITAEENRKKLKDYFEECRDLIRSDDASAPPRWFSPLECGSHSPDSPLLLFLPGMDGSGLGLVTNHHKLGKIFNMWCLHIPVEDRTSFTDLVQLVEKTVQSEWQKLPGRPIYLVGESLGGCIALDVAARNPNIDLVLILANPATSFSRSHLQSLIPLLELMPDQLSCMLNLVSGDPLRMACENVLKRLMPFRNIEDLSQNLVEMQFYHSVLADALPRETLLWKLKLLKSASASANSHLSAVKAQVLLLCSGNDQILPSQEEAKRLRGTLEKCEIRVFKESSHFLFLEEDFDLVTSIKGASFYRRGKHLNYVSDYIPPTPYEFKKVVDSYRWLLAATSPVMLSTLEDGKVVKGLAGIPSEGPVVFVGYHMLLGFDLGPMVIQFLMEKNILLRGIAHPMMFFQLREGKMLDVAEFDSYRLMGAVPVSGPNFYKLLSSNSHVLLYPGGVREALHRKGEEYKLFWPEQSEVVRMASRFGAKIIPFGVVGEDDVAELVFDYNDQMRIPFLRSFIEEITEEIVKLRTDANGEVSNQDVHLPGVLPKLPGRFYYYFGKPIETQGRKELRNREKSQELYLHIQSEVERCIAYLKQNREKDPYRNILPRLLYQVSHGFTADVPTFEL